MGRGPELPRRPTPTAPVQAPVLDATARPASCFALFAAFTRLALQGFGGVLPVAQRELVDRLHWLTRAQFLEMLALSQVLPGPNVVNLSLMVGQRFFGHRGAFAAMAGMLAAPSLLVLVLAVLAVRWQGVAEVAGALRGMGIVAAGLVVATALKLAAPLARSPLTLAGAAAVVAATFVAIGLLRWPLVAVVLGLGLGAWAAAAWRLHAAARRERGGG
ncbi:MAG: chromate transporter [Rubrivivax sp.]|nr:chromate transporter [Rubrivivax sp.]